MPSRTRPIRHLIAPLAVAALAFAGCSDDGDDGDDTSTSTTIEAVDSTLSTMAPDTTGDIGNETVPGDDPDDTGGADTTISGAVPGQDADRLEPPGDRPGGPSPEG